MFEISGDIWTLDDEAIIAITTNGSVTRDGRAIFGRGVARQALQRFPHFAEILGTLLQERGNHVHELGNDIVTFPVEETAWSLPDLRLITRSARELRELADRNAWQKIIVPRPGCGGGGLAWSDVQPLLAAQFDERFTVINQP